MLIRPRAGLVTFPKTLTTLISALCYVLYFMRHVRPFCPRRVTPNLVWKNGRINAVLLIWQSVALVAEFLLLLTCTHFTKKYFKKKRDRLEGEAFFFKELHCTDKILTSQRRRPLMLFQDKVIFNVLCRRISVRWSRYWSRPPEKY